MLGTETGSFSAVIESDRPIAADRLMWWGADRYGSSLESGRPAPAARWLVAEGATHGGFQLFYLVENPDPVRAADVRVTWLLPSGASVVRSYPVAPLQRLTIYANRVPELAATDVGAIIESLNGIAIVAERAMYRNAGSELFGAGHAGAGAAEPEREWVFAEGATGSFFSTYLLIANPALHDTTVTVRYQLPDGTVVSRDHPLRATSRLTIDVATEDPRLAATAVAMTVTSPDPVVAERAMWWPGPAFAPEWYEAHVSLGSVEPGLRWAVAGGSVGGALAHDTYVLIADQSQTPGTAQLTVIYDDGSTEQRSLTLAARSRTTAGIGTLFPSASGRSFSVLVESTGATPAPIVVEASRYGSAGGRIWTNGGAAVATRLP